MDVLREISPGSGVYMSEADLLESNLQEAFHDKKTPVSMQSSRNMTLLVCFSL